MDQFWIKKDPTHSFCRPEIAEDVKYRKIKKVTFEDELKKVLSKDCNFCFHGTTIWNTKSIIDSGEISAQIDREGLGEETLNTPGQIYVSTLNNLWFTVKHYADLGNYKYPAGCIFVISPQSEEEFKSAKEHNLIANVNIKEQSDRIKAIITTPENITRVQNWINESKLHLNRDIVVDYEQAIYLLDNTPSLNK